MVFFQVKHQKHFVRERFITSYHISSINHLDEHIFLMIFDHKQQIYAIGIKNMQANQLKICKAKEHQDSLSLI
jgi:hypothetical protein